MSPTSNTHTPRPRCEYVWAISTSVTSNGDRVARPHKAVPVERLAEPPVAKRRKAAKTAAGKSGMPREKRRTSPEPSRKKAKQEQMQPTAAQEARSSWVAREPDRPPARL